MPNSIGLRDYLETTTEATKRVRATTIILTVATVLLFAGYVNSIESSWIRARVIKLENLKSDNLKNTLRRIDRQLLEIACNNTENIFKLNYSKNYCDFCNFIHDEFREMEKETTWDEYKQKAIEGFYAKILGQDQVVIPDEYGKKSKLYADWKEQSVENIISWHNLNEKKEEAQIPGLKKLISLREKKHEMYYEYFAKTSTENVSLIRIPFINVAFDINDLTLLGGIAILIILTILRLSLRSYIISLKTSFKFALTTTEAGPFYDVLASRQLFVFPRLRDHKQTNYIGLTEKIWQAIKDKTVKKVKEKIDENRSNQLKTRSFERRFPHASPDLHKFEKDHVKRFRRAYPHGWMAYRGFVLKMVPKVLYFMPFAVYLMVVINDFASSESGDRLSAFRTSISMQSNLILLLCIGGLGFWCISKSIEIDYLWKYFELKVNMKEALDKTTSTGLVSRRKKKLRKNS